MKLRIVKPSQGYVWLRQGLQVSLRQSFQFVGLLGLCVSAALLLIGLPVVGPLLVVGCMPLMWLGFMQATRKVLQGERFHPGVLFEAFKGADSPRRTLAQLAGGYVMATLVVMQLAQLLGPGADEVAAVFETAETAAELVNHPLIQQDILWRVLLTLPVSLLFWHAPALILWARLSVSKALFFSIVACWRNLGAFAVYGLCWFGVVLALGLFDRFILSQIPVPLLGNVLAIAGGMWVASAFYASLYFTVVDCFESPVSPDVPTTEPEPEPKSDPDA
ncbi:BPSS1780 family membrane protein [Aquabacterium sp.]|uniref:BPSS1780 family membrane protein n=1 Tax=Aquabacterium sp. TaxID=1872578 RepID=UPI00261983E4|nr:BPSS1780 family membrane protein [Aquabacterium sp.]MDD2975810.1 BPSS1780 family membrane protein [Aquabacterium sp.]